MITIPAPPSKSETHRALVLAALAGGPSTVHNALTSDDTAHTRACLTALGAQFFPQEDGSLVVQPIPRHPSPCSAELFVGESGTTCRLMTAIAAVLPGSFRIYGSGRMSTRPIAPLTEALGRLGVDITFEGLPGCPPLRLSSSGWQRAHTTLDASASSQYLSALLLAAPRSPHGLVVDLRGERIASWPYAALTIAAMARAAVPVATFHHRGDTLSPCTLEDIPLLPPNAIRCTVPGNQPYRAGTFTVEGDWSSASYFLAAGALGRVPVTVTHLRTDSLQADRALVDILKRMGARVTVAATGITVWPSPLMGADLPMGACPDLVPTVAVLAAAAQGTTRIHGAAHLRLKESDRIAAVADGLTRLGVAVQTTDDGLFIAGGLAVRGPVELATFGDHRLAMSLSLTELLGVRPILDQPGCVAKSFPNFWKHWEAVRIAQQEAAHDA